MSQAGTPASGGARGWTFLTNHGHVLLAIARDPTARLRDLAETVGVTERAAHAIVADLEAGGYLRRTRVGRRNHYTVNPAGHFRHPAEADWHIGDFLALFDVTDGADPRSAGQQAAGQRVTGPRSTGPRSTGQRASKQRTG